MAGELINYAIGFLLMTILFAGSYLFWNWYTNKNKTEFKYQVEEDQNNSKKEEFSIDNLIKTTNTSPASTTTKKVENNSKAIEKLLSKDEPTELGGKTEKYNWSQTDKEVEVYIQVPSNTKGKDVNYKISSNHLTLKISGNVVIDGDLYAAVIPDECNWQIGKISTLIILLLLLLIIFLFF